MSDRDLLEAAARAETDDAPPKLAGEPGCRLCDGCGWVSPWSPCICSIPVRAAAALTQPEGGA